MNGNGEVVFKRCGCTDAVTGRQLAGRCPLLPEVGHGSWYYAVQVPTVGGRMARYRKGGYPTREAASAARRAVSSAPPDEAAAAAWTTAPWLRYWLGAAASRESASAGVGLVGQNPAGPGPRPVGAENQR